MDGTGLRAGAYWSQRADVSTLGSRRTDVTVVMQKILAVLMCIFFPTPHDPPGLAFVHDQDAEMRVSSRGQTKVVPCRVKSMSAQKRVTYARFRGQCG